MNYKKILLLVSLPILLLASMTSCDPSISILKYELPEANSKLDETPPSAFFTVGNTNEWHTFVFANGSTSATDYKWDFGDGNTSSEVDGRHTYSKEGTYTVKLIASDKLGVISEYAITIEVIKPDIPQTIVPHIINGDFEMTGDDKYLGWKMDKYSIGSSTPFGTSADGAFEDYEGNLTDSKTRGAKWTGSQGAFPVTDNTRFAYQAITISPNTEYVVEFSYSITSDGDEVILKILDGWFADSADAFKSEYLIKSVGDMAKGKGSFTKKTARFSSNFSGQVAIFIYVKSNSDVWIDNVKVYPFDLN